MFIEGTGEMRLGPQEVKRPAEQTISKLEISRDFRNWVKLNSEPAEHQKLPALRELTRVEHPFDVTDLKIAKTPAGGATSVEGKILSILVNRKFKRGNRNLINQEYLSDEIKKRTADEKSPDEIKERATGGKSPIEIVIPALPFKHPNPLTTRNSLSEVDLGEYLVFSQLRDLNESIKDVYEPGLKITVVADGSVYAGLFCEGKVDEIKQYQENCRKICKELKIENIVEIKDMEDLLKGKKEQLAQTQKEIENILRESERESKLENMESKVYMPMYKKEFRDAMESLQRSMLHLYPAPKEDFDKYAEYMSKPFKDLPQEFRDQIHEKSLQYASLYLAIGKLNIVSDAFPNALRATVHTKKDNKQIPLSLIPEEILFPWQGVPVVSESKKEKTNSFQESTRIMRYWQLPKDQNTIAITRHGHPEPFYYLIKDKQDKKIKQKNYP